MSETETLTASLKELRKSFDELQFELPKDFSESGQTVDEIYAYAKNIGDRVAASLKLLDGKETYFAEIKDRMKRRIAIDSWAKKEDEIQGFLEAALKHDVLYFKLAAAMSYLKYCFSLTFKSHEEASKMLVDLKNRGLLVEGGPIPIGYKKYQLGDFGFEPEDTKELESLITSFARKFMALEKQRRHDKSRVMEEDSNITMDELLDGKIGKCFMQVPPECYENRDGGTKWRAGGAIVVQATPKEVFPISATGGLETSVRDMRDIQVRLPRYSLKWDGPPGDGKNFSRVRDGVMKTRDVDEEEAQRYVNMMKVLWHLIHRAFKALDAKEKLGELNEEFRQRATISPEAFFGLNGSDAPENGIVCLEYEGAFKDADKPSIYNLFFLAERTEEDSRSVVSIVDMPPHTAEILGQLASKRFSEGENFKELPAVLRRVLYAIKGRLELASEIAKA